MSTQWLNNTKLLSMNRIVLSPTTGEQRFLYGRNNYFVTIIEYTIGPNINWSIKIRQANKEDITDTIKKRYEMNLEIGFPIFSLNKI